ncbi:hypothetical protein SBOR_8435 [Sclerotinia borealis F-4128]|uniref:Uncharacterized protein n=1 Tax=Sclerotinia borealis (strain F-4128) TaxID=1432307 RepID=W9C8J6_SCLBF|nr:hypothetical protein SBOR_8435 [Sclerotinia borealis F-4128]
MNEMRTRGLTGRQVIALLMMVGAQLIVTVVMLQMMLNGGGEGAGMGVADVLAVVQVPFAGAPYTVGMSAGDHGGVLGEGFVMGKGDKGKGDEGVVINEGRIKGMDGVHKVDEMDASEYLLSVKQKITQRITCHRTFITEKKHGLVRVLWEVIEGVYELEELVRESVVLDGASSATSAPAFTDAVNGDGDGDGDSNTDKNFDRNTNDPLRDDTKDGEKAWTEFNWKEGRVIGFRQEVEEKMEKSDFDGVLKMVKSGLTEAKTKIGKDESEKGDEKMVEKMLMVEESREKVQRGLQASREILREMEEEMRNMEGWLRGMEGVLGEVVGEFLGGLRL